MKCQFEWDAAVKKYGKDSLIKWGWGPYNAMVQLDNLTAAFKSKNKDSILFYAADLGHYVQTCMCLCIQP